MSHHITNRLRSAVKPLEQQSPKQQAMAPAAELLDNEQLAGLYEQSKAITAWLKAVEAEIIRRTEAGAMPGWRMVAGRGRRTWNHDAPATIAGVRIVSEQPLPLKDVEKAIAARLAAGYMKRSELPSAAAVLLDETGKPSGQQEARAVAVLLLEPFVSYTPGAMRPVRDTALDGLDAVAD